MSERRDRIGMHIRSHCRGKKQGDLLHIMEVLETSFQNYKLVAVHVPSDTIVFGEEYVGEQHRIIVEEEVAARGA
jgi:hypothetical protein